MALPSARTFRPARRGALAGLFTLTALATLTAGCGFQLRGSANLPFETLFVNTPPNSALGNEIKRNVRAGTATRVVDDPREAQARFELPQEARGKEILSYNSAGRVREYALLYTVGFRIHDGKGRDLIPLTTIALRREVSFNESTILANESEEGLMYRDMQSDVVQQVLRRMAAIRLPAAGTAPASPNTPNTPDTPNTPGNPAVPSPRS